MADQAEIQIPEVKPVKIPKEEFIKHENELASLNKAAQELVITDAASAGHVGEILARSRNAQRVLEEQRVALVQPLNNVVKFINNLFNALASRYDAPLELAQGKLREWNRKEEKRIADEKAKELKKVTAQNEKIIDKAEKDNKVPVLQQPKVIEKATIETPSARIQYRENRKYEISQKAKENICKMIPATFITYDEQKIAAAVRGKILEPGDHKWIRVWIEKEPIPVRH